MSRPSDVPAEPKSFGNTTNEAATGQNGDSGVNRQFGDLNQNRTTRWDETLLTEV